MMSVHIIILIIRQHVTNFMNDVGNNIENDVGNIMILSIVNHIFTTVLAHFILLTQAYFTKDVGNIDIDYS